MYRHCTTETHCGVQDFERESYSKSGIQSPSASGKHRNTDKATATTSLIISVDPKTESP